VFHLLSLKQVHVVFAQFRERVLFIGTPFSNLYTAVDTPIFNVNVLVLIYTWINNTLHKMNNRVGDDDDLLFVLAENNK
jgi:uncharacterized membrane protein